MLCHLPRAHLYDCIPLRSNSPPPYLGPLGSRVRGRPLVSGSPDWTHTSHWSSHRCRRAREVGFPALRGVCEAALASSTRSGASCTRTHLAAAIAGSRLGNVGPTVLVGCVSRRVGL